MLDKPESVLDTSWVRSISTLGALVFCVACVFSCDESDRGASDASTGSSPDSSNESPSDSAANERGSELDAAAPDSGATLDADGPEACETAESLPAECRDSDAGWADAATPPADCIAPCVWDLIKHCPPITMCSVPSGPAPCWFMGRCGADICLGERACYHFSTATIPPSGAFPHFYWSDADGNTVAEGYASSFDSPRTIVCGKLCLYFGDTPYYAPCDGKAAQYVVDPGQPHCAPWADW